MERLPEVLGLRGVPGMSWLRAAPMLLVALMIPLDILTPVPVQLWAMVTVLPPLAALVNGPVATAIVSIASVGITLLVGAFDDSDLLSEGSPPMAITVAIVGAVSVLITVLRDRVLSRLLRVASVAEAAQQALLPELPARIGPLRCAAVYRASAAESRLGGDFYDLIETPWGVRAVIGDVSGHGLGAVASVGALLGSFREGALDDVDLAGLGVRLERRMGMRNAEHDDWGHEFATALLMTFEPGGGSVEIRSFGHHPPLLLRDRKVIEVQLEPAPPLGVSGELSVLSTSVGRRLRPGDMFVAYTDGLVEARNRDGEQYPLTTRLRDRLQSEGSFTDPKEAADFVTGDVENQGYLLNDDLAVMAVGVRRS